MKLVGLDFEARESSCAGRACGPTTSRSSSTSGTTGESKGVLHTSNTLLSAVKALPPHLRLGARRDLHALAARAPARLHVRHADVAHARHSHRADRRVRAARGAADRRARRHLRLCGDAFPRRPGGGDAKLPSLRVFASAGAPIPPAVVQAARERLGLAVAASWGMTECGTVTCTPHDGSRAAESDGRALPNGEVRVIDGALQVRGASLFVGYLKRPHSTSSTPRAGSTPATSRAWTPRATSASAAAART